MFPHRLRVPSSVLALAAVFAFGACDYPNYHVGHPPRPDWDAWESEPNDSHAEPNVLGFFYVGDEFTLGGWIRDDVYDPFDGFAITSGEPLDISFVLEPVASNADLDLCVWDPQLGAFAFCFDSPNSVEVGRFSVPDGLTEFHMVVSSYSGDTEYRLRIRAEPLTFGALPEGAGAGSKPERAVPYDCYAAPRALAEPEAVAPRIVARGAYFEIDGETGAVRRRALVVLDRRAAAGP